MKPIRGWYGQGAGVAPSTLSSPPTPTSTLCAGFMEVWAVRIEELREWLQKFGIDISEKTLRRWGEAHLIEDHRPGLPGRGRENAEDWPEAALENACAVWAVRHYSLQTKRLSPKVIKRIKAVAEHLYVSPLAYYTLPHVVGPLLRFRKIPYEDVRVQFATEMFPVLDLVPGKNIKEKTSLLNALIRTWIATCEKVRFSKKWNRVPCPSPTGEEKDRQVAMRVKDKVQVVKAQWPMEDPACIYLSHQYARFEPIEEITFIGPGGTCPVSLDVPFDRVYVFKRSYIAPSDLDRDEVILLENDVDTRKLFVIADASEDKNFLEGLRREQLDELPEYYTMT